MKAQELEDNLPDWGTENGRDQGQYDIVIDTKDGFLFDVESVEYDHMESQIILNCNKRPDN